MHEMGLLGTWALPVAFSRISVWGVISGSTT